MYCIINNFQYAINVMLRFHIRIVKEIANHSIKSWNWLLVEIFSLMISELLNVKR
jgi:hypothetical protein